MKRFISVAIGGAVLLTAIGVVVAQEQGISGPATFGAGALESAVRVNPPTATPAAPAPTTPAAPTPNPKPATIPSGAQWSETFTGNTGLDRFRTGVYHRDTVIIEQNSWQGDHDMDCGPPTTTRTVHRNKPSESFYTCKDHLMTSVGDTSGYSVAFFSPKQVFDNVTEVCWSVNLTNLGTRQWWKVGVLSVNAPDVMSDVGASDLSGLVGPDRAIASWSGPGAWQGKISAIDGIQDWYGFYANGDKATRYPACFRDNGNGTVTFTLTGPMNGGAVTTESLTTAGSFPKGPKKVVFMDHNYTPSKSDNQVGGTNVIGYTWHWDDISVR